MLEESTDSDFTITYEGVLSSPRQDSVEEGVRFDVDMNEDSSSQRRSIDEEEGLGEKATRLSPRQRHRRQSLARFKKKQWGDEWLI